MCLFTALLSLLQGKVEKHYKEAGESVELVWLTNDGVVVMAW
jgi:hypothetical protein